MKWIPTYHELPPERVNVLGLIPCEDNEIAVVRFEIKEGFYLSYDCEFKCDVEYWCHLPKIDY